MRGIIAAVSPTGIIGIGGKIPWHYPGDLKRFKELTTGTTIIMGRLTWESLGRPLPKRRNIVITSQRIPNVECFPSVTQALETIEGDVWFIGGAKIYEEAMNHAEIIDLTFVPDEVHAKEAVYFPPIDPVHFEAEPLRPHEYEPKLKRRRYHRVRADSQA